MGGCFFTRKAYRDIVVDSLRHCQGQKGLLLHGWCIMNNHLHLLASAQEANLSNILRDFKKFISKRLIAAVQYMAESLQLKNTITKESTSNEMSEDKLVACIIKAFS